MSRFPTAQRLPLTPVPAMLGRAESRGASRRRDDLCADRCEREDDDLCQTPASHVLDRLGRRRFHRLHRRVRGVRSVRITVRWCLGGQYDAPMASHLRTRNPAAAFQPRCSNPPGDCPRRWLRRRRVPSDHQLDRATSLIRPRQMHRLDPPAGVDHSARSPCLHVQWDLPPGAAREGVGVNRGRMPTRGWLVAPARRCRPVAILAGLVIAVSLLAGTGCGGGSSAHSASTQPKPSSGQTSLRTGSIPPWAVQAVLNSDPVVIEGQCEQDRGIAQYAPLVRRNYTVQSQVFAQQWASNHRDTIPRGEQLFMAIWQYCGLPPVTPLAPSSSSGQTGASGSATLTSSDKAAIEAAIHADPELSAASSSCHATDIRRSSADGSYAGATLPAATCGEAAEVILKNNAGRWSTAFLDTGTGFCGQTSAPADVVRDLFPSSHTSCGP